MKNNQLLFEYKGNLSFEQINIILLQLEDILKKLKVSLNLSKTLYSIMVECLENIYRHYYLNNEPESFNYNEFQPLIQFYLNDNKNFQIIGCNLISNNNIEKLKNKIDYLNSLDNEGIKNFFKNSMRELIDKKAQNTAGIGLIEIAKLSNKKINYNFEKINNEMSYFKIIIEVECSQCVFNELVS